MECEGKEQMFEMEYWMGYGSVCLMPAPLVLSFYFQDQMCVKTLDYTLFAHWEAVEAVLEELAEIGIVVEALWDTAEDMQVSSGDWDARVRPGWNVDVLCLEGVGEEWDEIEESESGGSDFGDEEVEVSRGSDWCLARREKERMWWFARWRERVEREMRDDFESRLEPSWEMVTVWCFSMVTFTVVVSVLCA